MENIKRNSSVRTESARLIRKVDAGCKFATESITLALDYSKNPEMQKLLDAYNKLHEALKKDIIAYLHKMGANEKSHPAIAAAMTKLHINLSLSMSAKNCRIAELMINGCHMGIKTIYKEKNRNPNASSDAQSLADDLIAIEEDMMADLYRYLH